MMFLKLRIFLLRTACSVRFSNTHSWVVSEFGFSPKFTDTEQEKILNIINKSSTEHLLSLNISQAKIKSLESYKRKKGSFQSLDELLDVDGLSIKLLEKICKQIISPPAQNDKSNGVNRKTKQMIVPTLPVTTKITSVVAVHLATTAVSWAKILNIENELDSWGYRDFETLPKKVLPTDTFKLAMTVLTHLPIGDAYIFEGSSNMQTQKKPVTYTQNLELLSMLVALVNTSARHNSNEDDNKVHFLKSKLAARLFKTLVGNECVSNTTTVLQFLKDSNFALPCTPITVSEQQKNDYLGQSSAHKELLGQALLLGVAATDLCIKKNSVSINAIAPGKK